MSKIIIEREVVGLDGKPFTVRNVADNYNFREWFTGKRNGKFTPEQYGQIIVQGHRVVLFSAAYARLLTKRRGRGVHRVYAECLDCGKMVPAGRLAQHSVMHDPEQREAERARRQRAKERRKTRGY